MRAVAGAAQPTTVTALPSHATRSEAIRWCWSFVVVVVGIVDATVVDVAVLDEDVLVVLDVLVLGTVLVLLNVVVQMAFHMPYMERMPSKVLRRPSESRGLELSPTRRGASRNRLAFTNIRSYTSQMLPEPLTPESVDRLRRSVAMLTPRHHSALDREAALALLEELQRLQGADRRLGELVEALRGLLRAAEAAG